MDEHEGTTTQGGVSLDLLTEPWRNTNLRVYMDRFYTSAEVFKLLHRKGVYAAGTCQSDRGFPKELAELSKSGTPVGGSKMEDKGSWRTMRAEAANLTAYTWHDSKVTNFISTMHDNRHETSVLRRDKAGDQHPRPCPAVAEDYNLHMWGVDLMDQRVALHPMFRTHRKWWTRVLHWSWEVMLSNMFVLWAMCCFGHTDGLPRRYSPSKFKERIIADLFEQNLNHRRLPYVGSDRTPPSPGTKRQRISPAPVPSNDRRRCRVCQANGIERRSRSKCRVCGIAVCAKTCFQFHKC